MQTQFTIRWCAMAAVAVIVAVSLSQAADDQPSAIDGPWRYTTDRPADGWQKGDFDDSGWTEGFGGFGTWGTPNARVNTEWDSPDIWVRRTIELDEIPQTPALLIHHDEDTEVYINGTQVATFSGYITDYKVAKLSAEAHKALKQGKNLLAAHTHQTGGGQYIDVHLIDADNVPRLPAVKPPTKPYQSDLITTWGEKVTPENAWREYPRPAMSRKQWTNLNGEWDYAITSAETKEKPGDWDGKILVPFALESKLSGVNRLLDPSEALWYHRTVKLTPKEGERTLLNFEAVDYSCQVYLNDQEVGGHVGGNTPFQLDVTKAAKEGENHLVVRVEDKTGGAQLRGKQSMNPEGIWYTRVSGIWQTVWLEQVSSRHIADVKISTSAETGQVTIRPELAGDDTAGLKVKAQLKDGDEAVAEGEGGGEIQLTVENAKLWSPDSPHLYDITLTLVDAEGQAIDTVETYTGIRTVGTTRDEAGHLRFTLNGKEIFHWGPLDQGWWPDGLLTPPSEEAMRFDVEYLKQSGFNMIRKHIKVEPRRYYYDCDRLGMLVWQDQVSGRESPPWTRMQPNPQDANWSDEDHAQFMRELEAMIGTLENHPSIVVWVPFNEAWGQHRTMEVGKWTVERDPTRLVNIASGGNFWPVGHIADHHNYPEPAFPLRDVRFNDFVKVVGEFGGHGWPVEGHLWKRSTQNWGYGGLPKSIEEYRERYENSIRRLAQLQKQGIAAGVYTQTTDVENEINGLMTYDRKVIKIPAEDLKKIHEPLLE